MKRAMRMLGNRLTSAGGGSAAFGAGKNLIARGKYELAAEAFADAETAFRKRLGPTHEWVTQSQAYRAWCCVRLGRFSEGIALYESVLALEERESNPADPRVLEVLEQLVDAYESSGRREDAARVRAELEARRAHE